MSTQRAPKVRSVSSSPYSLDVPESQDLLALRSPCSCIPQKAALKSLDTWLVSQPVPPTRASKNCLTLDVRVEHKYIARIFRELGSIACGDASSERLGLMGKLIMGDLRTQL